MVVMTDRQPSGSPSNRLEESAAELNCEPNETKPNRTEKIRAELSRALIKGEWLFQLIAFQPVAASFDAREFETAQPISTDCRRKERVNSPTGRQKLYERESGDFLAN